MTQSALATRTDRTPRRDEAPVPPHFHVLWTGDRPGLLTGLTVEAIRRRCPGAALTVWHPASAHEDARSLLASRTGATLRPLDLDALLEGEVTLPRKRLQDCWRRFQSAEARLDLARLLILYREGGVVLDAGTLVLRDFEPLLGLGAFAGVEHADRTPPTPGALEPAQVVGAPLRALFRDACAALPGGDALSRRFETVYERSIGTAVLGAAPRHRAIEWALTAIARLPDAWLFRPEQLAAGVLRQAATRPELGLMLQMPDCFYPVNAGVSAHYFRPQRDVDAARRRMISDETFAVCWYAPVEVLDRYEPAQLLAEADQTVFSALWARVLGETAADRTPRGAPNA